MPNRSINLFALLDDEANPVRKIPVTGPLQAEMSGYLMEQKERFYGTGHQRVEFTASYSIDDGEINFIPSFPLEGHISNAVENPLDYESLDLRVETHAIKALFFGFNSGSDLFVGFQAFDSRKVLRKGFTILNSGNTYKKLEDPGLTLQNSLTAIYEKGELTFYSYFNTKKFVDLSRFYIEATDTDIAEFASNKLFEVEDIEAIKAASDQIVRKKIALLHKNKVLESVTIKSIGATAKEYGVDLDIKNNKLLLPSDKKKLKNLIRFLDENYFTAPLTGRKCLTNSKRYL